MNYQELRDYEDSMRGYEVDDPNLCGGDLEDCLTCDSPGCPKNWKR